MSSAILGQILGPDGLIVVAVIALVLIFGGTQLPKLARGLGSASHEFRKGVADGDAEGSSEVPKPDAQPTAS